MGEVVCNEEGECCFEGCVGLGEECVFVEVEDCVGGEC